MLETVEYINWFNSPNWQANILLGNSGKRYDFTAHWNIRDNSWYVTISSNGEIIISSVGVRLNTNLLEYTYGTDIPNCLLYLRSDDANIDRITYNNMINGTVKMYHILPENIINE